MLVWLLAAAAHRCCDRRLWMSSCRMHALAGRQQVAGTVSSRVRLAPAVHFDHHMNQWPVPKFNWSSQHRGTSVPASTSLRSPWRTRSTPFLSVRAVRSSLFQPPAGGRRRPPVEPCIHGSTSLVPLQWHGARSLWPWAWRCWCPLMPRTAPRLQPAILVSQIKRIARSSNGRRNMDLFGRAKQLIQRFCGR